MDNYSVIVQYDPIDGIFIASIPELQGCMAHGRSKEAAIQEVSIVKDMWIENAKEMGIDIPKPHLYSTAVG